jgi:hypothetical protein
MNYSALTWVNPAIDDTLKQVRQALEQFVENPDETVSLQEAVHGLGEIQGALSMLDITSAVVLVREMENITKLLLQGKLTNRELAYDLLMRAIIQLPNYLMHLGLGYADIPVALLPLINKLRALYGQAPLSANTLFLPDVSVPLPVKPAPTLPDVKLKEFIQRFRALYQKGLLLWLKGPNRMEGLKTMLTALGHLTQVTGGAPITRLWWISEALLEAVAQKGLAPNEALNNLLKQIDAHIKLVFERGNIALRMAPPHKLVVQLLFYAAQAKSTGPRLAAVKATFKLDYYLPDEAHLQEAQQVFSGPDIELMKNVVGAMQDDFARIEETLDIFMRSDNPDVNDLQPLIEVMRTTAYTLRLLDLEAQCSAMLAQAKTIEAIVSQQKSHDLNEMLQIADVLLKIEAAMRTLASRGIHARRQIQKAEGLLETQFQDVLRVIVEEAKIELAEMLQPIVNFIETATPDEALMAIPARFKQIEGFLHMMEQIRAIKLIRQLSAYVSTYLLQKTMVPGENERKALADALISLEFYLDTLAGNPMDANQILNITQTCLHRLNPSSA